jgi:hypothetical protein
MGELSSGTVYKKPIYQAKIESEVTGLNFVAKTDELRFM